MSVSNIPYQPLSKSVSLYCCLVAERYVLFKGWPCAQFNQRWVIRVQYITENVRTLFFVRERYGNGGREREVGKERKRELGKERERERGWERKREREREKKEERLGKRESESESYDYEKEEYVERVEEKGDGRERGQKRKGIEESGRKKETTTKRQEIIRGRWRAD